jgi:hypothetical protein
MKEDQMLRKSKTIKPKLKLRGTAVVFRFQLSDLELEELRAQRGRIEYLMDFKATRLVIGRPPRRG